MNEWPTIRASQAKLLEGKTWNLEGRQLRFGSFHAGGEAFAVAMLNEAGAVQSFLRFLNERFISPGRIHRTGWLIGQRLNKKSQLFRGAPRAWASTRTAGRPPGIHFDFTATLHDAAAGKSWKEIKADCELGVAALPPKPTRLQAARHLIAALAALESIGFVHGDLSDGNIVLDGGSGSLLPIDFDAFVYKQSSTLKHPQLPVSAGGVKGTLGYMPLDLERRDGPPAPAYSDRHARDMLLLELLGFTAGDPPDLSPQYWGEPELTFEAVSPGAQEMGLPYLLQPSVFTAAESERPSSRQLASLIQVAPERIAS